MIEFQNVTFSYGNQKILEDFSFALPKGKIFAVMGKSGCGKTTLLQLAAGLLKPNSGRIISQATKISYAFQEPRLFPWLTVAQNIGAVLNTSPTPEEMQRLLSAVELEECGELYPHQLSGGMKSRVALARALAYYGDLFLLDEPFSALNEELCATLATRLRQHLQERNASAILVTHRPADAEALADQILEL